VETLVSSGLVASVADLFTLQPRRLRERARFGPVAAANLLRSIDAARRASADRVLYALGIPGVGVSTARRIARAFGTLQNIRSADADRISRAAGVGRVVAGNVVAFFRAPGARKLIDRLLALGIEARQPRANNRGRLAGKTVVFTGTLARMSRRDAGDLVDRLGGRTAEGVSGGTDLVVVGNNPGSKLSRAAALGVRTVSEAEFFNVWASGAGRTSARRGGQPPQGSLVPRRGVSRQGRSRSASRRR
jgi:DNA ligase (NAD+)